MRYKRSCFNSTLMKHDLRRFWPMPVVLLLLFLLLLLPSAHSSLQFARECETSTVFLEGSYGGISYTSQDVLSIRRCAIYHRGGTVVMLEFVSALLSALLVMHHIHGRRQLQFYHGLPLTRRCLYLTSTVTGYFLGLVPLLISELCLMAMACSMGAELFPSLQLMGLTLSSFTIFFGIAMIACTLAGQTLGAVLLYGGMNCFVFAVMTGGAGVARFILYGYDQSILLEDITTYLTPLLVMGNAANPLYNSAGQPAGFPLAPICIYFLVGLGLLGLGCYLYQIRQGEKAGEMIAFSGIKWLCTILVALIAGLLGTVTIVETTSINEDISFPAVTLMVLGFMILGWFATEMVVRKSFRVLNRKTLSGCAGLCLFSLLILTGANLDVFGYVNHIPALDEASSACISLYGTTVELDTQDAISLHETILGHQEELSNNTGINGGVQLTLDYYRDDALSMTRTYYIRLDTSREILNTLLSISGREDYVYQSWLGNDTGTENLSRVEMYSYSTYSDETGDSICYFLEDGQPLYDMYVASSEDALTLYQAVIQDIRQHKLLSCYYYALSDDTSSVGSLDFTFLSDPYEAMEYNRNTTETSRSYYVTIYPFMEHTLDALSQLGITFNKEAGKG